MRMCLLRIGALIVMSWLMGSVSVQAESHHPQEFLDKILGQADEGQQIVQHFCVNCHAKKPLIQLGAPRIGQQADWQVRVQQGLQTLFKHTDEGYHAMPPRGGCFECTDSQLLKAIRAMLPPIKTSD